MRNLVFAAGSSLETSYGGTFCFSVPSKPIRVLSLSNSRFKIQTRKSQHMMNHLSSAWLHAESPKLTDEPPVL